MTSKTVEAAFPAHYGMSFTPTIHQRAEGSTLPENNKLTNSPSEAFIVVVTGAGKGLGYAISLAYARAGATGLAISSRTQSDLDALEKDLWQINPKLQILKQVIDTSKPEDVQRIADGVKKTFNGRLDAVIANAGIISKYVYDEDPSTGEKINRHIPKGIVEDDDFARVININVLGSFYTAKYLVPLLRSGQNPSHVRAYVVITSLASHLQDSQLTSTAYNMSKIAVNRMAENIQNDHGKEGVLAFAVHPGAVLTPRTENHSNKKGDVWDQGESGAHPQRVCFPRKLINHLVLVLHDDIGLCGGFLTWLTREKREWLGGRYLSVAWDVEELEKMKDEIVKEDKLKFRMVV